MLHRLSAPSAFTTGTLWAVVWLGLAGCASDPAPLPVAPAVRDTSRVEAVDEPAVVGATVYVPVYSHIFHQNGTRELDLTATLSIRNTDPERALTVAAVGYYDSAGRRVRDYAERPFRLGPLASAAFVIEGRDRTGGVGANFLVEWHAAAEVSTPLIEAVMVSTEQSLGISMVSRGEAVRSLDGAGSLDVGVSTEAPAP